jgi:hypothetical protein
MFDEIQNWFDEITDPYELFNAIEIFYSKLGVEPSFPNKCSIELLKQSRPSWFKPLTDNPKEFWSDFHVHIEHEFIWLREPTKAERKMKFAHAFDKRAMFLSAMRNTLAGAESFEYFENLKYSDLPKKAVGLCEIAKPKFDSPILPELGELAGQLFDGQTRFYTRYLQLFDKHFQSAIKIKKAWLWTEPTRIFEKFAVTLGNAIKETRSKETPEIAYANAAMKSLYTKFIGWFDRGSFLESPGDWAGELYRPDWRGLIIADANCNLLENIIEVFRFTGKIPFAIYHDCLMYFSDFENPHHEFNGTSLLDENKFSHEWTLPAIRVLKAIKDGESAGKIDAIGKEAK